MLLRLVQAMSIGADPTARILERVASLHGKKNHLSHEGTSSYNHLKLKLQNETNQRTYAGQVKSMFDELNDLPWN